jgi:hypothetical protein
MAKGSEQFTWKAYSTPVNERVCAVCGKQLKVADVRQINNRMTGEGSWVTEFYCTDERPAA